MPNTPTPETDLWLDDDGFGGVNFTPDKIEPNEENLPMIAPDLNPQIITNVPAFMEEEPVAEAPQPAQAEPEEPLIFTNPDGSYTSIEKSSKGWKGTIDIGTGSQQVFYGKTKDELIQNLLTAQLHGTKKIREQNRKIKLGSVDDTPTERVATARAEKTIGRELTADEKVELRLLLETDPDKAFDNWFVKRTGFSLDQLVARANAGDKAQRELYLEGVHKTFLAENTSYYGDPNFENYNTLITYLAKHKLRRSLKKGHESEVIDDLIDGGFYTASNLEEAFTELTEAGLLLPAPRTPEKPQTVPVPAPPVQPAAPVERIVRTETRPRAGLGIRTSEASPRVPDTKPLSVEDLNSLSTEEINKLYDQSLFLARKSYQGRR